MWSTFGIACALGLAVFAFTRSRQSGGFYDAAVYGMTARSHRVYATASLALVVTFCVTLILRAENVALVAFAFFVLLAVFYLTSFLRGFSDDQE